MQPINTTPRVGRDTISSSEGTPSTVPPLLERRSSPSLSMINQASETQAQDIAQAIIPEQVEARVAEGQRNERRRTLSCDSNEVCKNWTINSRFAW